MSDALARVIWDNAAERFTMFPHISPRPNLLSIHSVHRAVDALFVQRTGRPLTEDNFKMILNKFKTERMKKYVSLNDGNVSIYIGNW